jgi:hypothetical protein
MPATLRRWVPGPGFTGLAPVGGTQYAPTRLLAPQSFAQISGHPFVHLENTVRVMISCPLDLAFGVRQLLLKHGQEPRCASEMATSQARIRMWARSGLDRQMALTIGKSLRLNVALEDEHVFGNRGADIWDNRA